MHQQEIELFVIRHLQSKIEEQTNTHNLQFYGFTI